MNTTPEWARGLAVEVDGTGVVSHVGTAALRLLAAKTGLTDGLSTALRRTGFLPVHDRGQVVTDLAVMIADGGEAISDITTLAHQGELLGPVASMPTAWRTLHEITDVQHGRIARARATTRRHIWKLITARHGAIPAATVAGGDLGRTIVIRLDATLITAHSDKEWAAPTYKHTFGFHPLTAWCDNTRESLVVKLRSGNAGANTVADHLQVLTEAIAGDPCPVPPESADHLRRGRCHPGPGPPHHRTQRPARASGALLGWGSTWTPAPATRSAACPSRCGRPCSTPRARHGTWPRPVSPS